MWPQWELFQFCELLLLRTAVTDNLPVVWIDRAVTECVAWTWTGASAGANLAAAVSLKVRDIGNYLRPSLQVLIVPCLQALDFRTPSYQQNADSAYLPSHQMANYWLWYARGMDGHNYGHIVADNKHVSSTARMSQISRHVDHNLIPRKYISVYYVPDPIESGNDELWKQLEPVFVDPYFAPLMAGNLVGLPLTYIATAQYDILRDDGIMYAKRLSAAGIEVQHVHYDHAYHDLFRNYKHIHQSQIFIDDLVSFLSSRLWWQCSVRDYIF